MEGRTIRVYVKPVESEDQNLVYSQNVVPMYIGSDGHINACNASNIVNPNMSNVSWYRTASLKRLFKMIDPTELENYEDVPVYSVIIGNNLVVDKESIVAANELARIIPFTKNFIQDQKKDIRL